MIHLILNRCRRYSRQTQHGLHSASCFGKAPLFLWPPPSSLWDPPPLLESGSPHQLQPQTVYWGGCPAFAEGESDIASQGINTLWCECWLVGGRRAVLSLSPGLSANTVVLLNSIWGIEQSMELAKAVASSGTCFPCFSFSGFFFFLFSQLLPLCDQNTQ